MDFLQLKFTKSLQNEQHVHELLLWANRWLGRQIPELLVSLGYALVLTLYGFHSIYPTTKFSFGPTLIYFVNFFHVGLAFYAWISLMAFILRLKNWDLILYPDDPASSPILLQLSMEINSFILVISIIFAILYLPIGLVGALNFTTILPYIVLCLIPILLLFVLGNQTFSHQIIRVKYKRLAQIQSRIMKLSSNVEKMDTDTIAQVKSLIEYHDRVKSSRNSIYNTQSLFNILGSLALPALSAILSTIDVWQKIFGKP